MFTGASELGRVLDIVVCEPLFPRTVPVSVVTMFDLLGRFSATLLGLSRSPAYTWSFLYCVGSSLAM